MNRRGRISPTCVESTTHVGRQNGSFGRCSHERRGRREQGGHTRCLVAASLDRRGGGKRDFRSTGRRPLRASAVRVFTKGGWTDGRNRWRRVWRTRTGATTDLVP